MIKLTPRENYSTELPDPVQGLVLTNETIASLDLDVEVDGNNLKVTVQAVHLGKQDDAPFETSKKKWKLG